MNIPDLEARYLIRHDLKELDMELIGTLWELFTALGTFWAPKIDPAPMKSDFAVFLSNRIELDYNYLADYHNAAEVFRALKADPQSGGVDTLFTDAGGTVFPPATRTARARQLVVYEFIACFLAWGGFADFGSPLNYQGYIGGPNLPGQAPYRTYTPAA